VFLAIHLSTPLEIHGLITATLFFLLMYQDSNGQVTACVDRCCACRHRHLEVWPRPGSDTARRTSLARRHRPGVFQAGSDSSPASVRPRTAVPVGLLRSGRRCRHSAAPAFRQPSTACSTSQPAQHLRLSGLFSCRPQSQLSRLRRYERILVEIVMLETRWVTLSANFRGNGESSTNECWHQKTGLWAITWRCLRNLHLAVLIQYRRVTDRQTDTHTTMANTRAQLSPRGKLVVDIKHP